MAQYEIAVSALREMTTLGGLAQTQVEALRVQLQGSAARWRNRVYASAFPSTQQDLVEAAMSSEGALDLMVGARGVSAPAQHVANASALRASLLGFYFAFWEYVLKDRGGLRLLLLDDPQELLDEENRERLAHSFADLLAAQAQLVVTTYDRKFADLAARLRRQAGHIDHRSVEPVTRIRSTVQTPVCVMEISRLEAALKDDPDDENLARIYTSECRLFIEARLGDIFDDAAHPASSASKALPSLVDHLNRLRGLVRSPPVDLFRSPALTALAMHPGLADGADPLALLNKAHHRKNEIRPQDVALVFQDLIVLRRLAEKGHEACRMWRRRVPEDRPTATVVPLAPIRRPKISVAVQPDLAAFTKDAAVGESQAKPEATVEDGWFAGKSLFLLRSDNFGFAAPRGSVVIVEAQSDAVGDRDLVIARRGKSVFARRLLRSATSGVIGLAAETPDPRRSPQTLLFPETEVSLHRVVGVIVHHAATTDPRAKAEAVQIDDLRVLEHVKAAYEVREGSAVPLALPRQIVLGGEPIPLEQINSFTEELAALHLDDGSSVFKRIGSALPKPLSHLRQFESIGGLGNSQIFAVGEEQPGVRTVVHARLIVGVLYHS